MIKEKIAVLGAGSWGTALSVLLSNNGHEAKVWTRSSEKADKINSIKENTDFLPGVTIPEAVTFTSDIDEAVRNAKVILMVSPSKTTRELAKRIAHNISSSNKIKPVIVSCEKGLEEGTSKRLSEVIKEEIKETEVAVLSGPSHAEEVSRKIPTTVAAASEKKDTAEYIQDLFMTSEFRVYTNPDIIGVELGGALKNVIALCAGISDGLGYGDNTKAALMTRGIAEISRLGTAMGAMPQTFAGLTGIGDLIVTCTSMHSRNRKAGILIGKGMKAEDAVKEVKMVVEGIVTANAAYQMAKKAGVEMPIVSQAYEILYKGKDPKQAVAELMMRSKTHESEEAVLSLLWE